MNQATFDLFPNAAAEAQARLIAQNKQHWESCWGWTPRVGEPASFGCVCAVDTTGQQHYVTMASAIIRELSDTECLLEYVETLPGDPCGRHGKLFRLSLADLWVNVNHENQKRKQRHAA